jgi:hypothetical protein
MADSKRDYQVGPGRSPLHTRFKKGQSGNPGGRSTKSLPALLADALYETVYVTTDGRRRHITKREAIVAQMLDKSASADLRATKMLGRQSRCNASIRHVARPARCRAMSGRRSTDQARAPAARMAAGPARWWRACRAH